MWLFVKNLKWVLTVKVLWEERINRVDKSAILGSDFALGLER